MFIIKRVATMVSLRYGVCEWCFLYFHINHLISDWKFQSFHKLIFVIDLTLWLYIHYTNSACKQHFFSSKCATSLQAESSILTTSMSVWTRTTHSFSKTQFLGFSRLNSIYGCLFLNPVLHFLPKILHESIFCLLYFGKEQFHRMTGRGDIITLLRVTLENHNMYKSDDHDNILSLNQVIYCFVHAPHYTQ